MRIVSYQFSDIGARPLNEDCVGTVSDDGRFCFTLCDGLGGHARGEVASQCVCSVVGETFSLGAHCALPALMERAILRAQEALQAEQAASGVKNGMKTTLCCLMLDGVDACAAHVGDSRIYRFRAGKLLARTLDHSVSQHLVSIGALQESELRHHEDRNRLLRVMGSAWDTPQFQLFSGLSPIQSGDAFLLCSDGFWEWIEDADMERLLLASASPEDWACRMHALIQKNCGGSLPDNASAIAVFAE